MKKALVVFLILAVAGGLFAQLTFSGSVETGIAVGLSDQEGSKAQIDFIQNRGDHGMRAQVTANYSGEGNYGKFGAGVQIGANSNLFQNGGPDFFSETWHVSWDPNSMVGLRIGRGGYGGFGTPAGLITISNDWQPGLEVLLKPADGVKIGLDVLYGASHNDSSGLLENLRYCLGLAYSGIPILDIVAGAQLRTAMDPYGLYFTAGARFKGVPGLQIAADVAGYDFGNGEKNFIGASEQINFSTGGLSLMGRAQEFIALGSKLETSFIPMLFQGEVSYKASDVVTIGVEGRYLIGRDSGILSNYRNASEIGSFGDGAAAYFIKDNKAQSLGISPRITFNLNKPTIVLGWNFRTILTDGVKPTADKATTLNLVYAQFTVSF